MKPVIVADTGPLIGLAKLRQLKLLSQVFSAIHVPETVFVEATRDLKRQDARLIRDFAKRHLNIHADTDDEFFAELLPLLDEGEIQALRLAKELGCAILMDERRGRRVAHYYHIPVIGLLGLLAQAKQAGCVEHVRPLIEQLQAANYRLSPGLIDAILQKTEEA